MTGHRLSILALGAGALALSATAVYAQTSKEYAPGQQQTEPGSSKAFAPGQMKGAGESARELAPGQQNTGGQASGRSSSPSGSSSSGKILKEKAPTQ